MDIIDDIIQFQSKFPNIYIGGSVSLILQNIIPYRVPKDIDIISKNKIHIYDLFGIDKIKYSIAKVCMYNNIKWEIFYNANAEYIEYEYKNHIIKLSPAQEIYKWKYKNTGPSAKGQKHIKDILEYEQQTTINRLHTIQ